MGKMKLFCLPYAGGGAGSFSKWRKYLHPEIELIPVELAGRGSRMREPLYRDAYEAIEDVFQHIKGETGKGPYAIFGHSMGSMIGYYVIRKIRDNHLPGPLHAFFSGREAPHIKREDKKKYHLMSDADFQQEIIDLGGTPPEFFEHPELVEVFLPVLKNDFKIAECGVEDTGIQPLDIDITIFLGRDEDLSADECDGWKYHTKKYCTTHYFPGGHFFLQEETERLLGLIDNTMRACCKDLSTTAQKSHAVRYPY